MRDRRKAVAIVSHLREPPSLPTDAEGAEEAMQATLADENADAVSMGAPPRLGRYEIREPVGAGAMGVVFSARDPELERELAIKFMQPGLATDRGRARFLREAKAMAQLQHANVVTVYDVGTKDGRVFVVMDFVRGSTMREWLAAEARTWTATLDLYLQAGRGLAAAHQAGLVHRDFKPENVLVGEQGEVKVTDFGLARAIAAIEEDDVDDVGEEPPTVTETPDTLTRTGALLGTPAYMAPEHVEGQVDARSDQFSFCVSVYEGLYGRRPFAGDDLAATLANARAGNIRPGPGDAKVPGWVRTVLLRGLCPNPAGRWPSMQTLLDQLDWRRRTARRRWAWAVGAVAIAATAVALSGATNRVRAWWQPVHRTLAITDADLTAPMTLERDAAGVPYACSPTANKGRVELDVDVPVGGEYYLWGRVWEVSIGGTRGDADSFIVYVDDGAERLWHFGCQNEGQAARGSRDHWRWQRVLHMPNADSDCVIEDLRWDLTAGEHRIVIRNREDAASPDLAARISAVVVTNDPDYVPPDD